MLRRGNRKTPVQIGEPRPCCFGWFIIIHLLFLPTSSGVLDFNTDNQPDLLWRNLTLPGDLYTEAYERVEIGLIINIDVRGAVIMRRVVDLLWRRADGYTLANPAQSVYVSLMNVTPGRSYKYGRHVLGLGRCCVGDFDSMASRISSGSTRRRGT